MEKEYFCDYCLDCENDCKRKSNVTECINYNKGYTIDEYNEMIREQNVNIRRLCKENNLKLYIMLDMLKGQKIFKYKYRKILESRILEKNIWIKYMEEGAET